MSKSDFLIAGSIFFAVGIWVGSVFTVDKIWVFSATALCAAAAGLGYYVNASRFFLVALLLLCGTLGTLRMGAAERVNEYQSLYGTKHELEGYIVEDIDTRLDKQLVTFQPNGFEGRVLLTLPKTQEYFYGDRVVVNGKFTEAKSSQDFDYKKYLERHNVYALMYYPKVLVLKNNQLSHAAFSLLKLKYWFSDRVGEFLGEPQKSLLLGILIGARKTLPPEVVDSFKLTGTSHIIAISGFNISIIITALGYTARYLGRRASFIVSLFIIAAFLVITGASASVVRASVMGLLLLVALNIGRQYRIAASMFFAGLVMLALNPKILLYDAGFQLSFLATLGIVYFMPYFEQLTQDWPNPWQLKSMFFVTIAAMVATLPLLLFEFGTLSLVAPAVNMLILPIIPVTMLLGFLSVLPFVGSGCAFVAGLFLTYILKTTKYFASISYSSLEMVIPGWFFALSLTMVLLLLFVVRYYALRKPALVDVEPKVW